MRKLLLVAFCLLVFGSAAMAQTPYETKWHCPKPPALQKYDVGDVPGHSYVIAQGTCDVTTSKTGEKSAAYTEFQELWKSSYTNRGRFNTTLDNGDMAYYTYSGSGSMDVKKPSKNTFKMVSGTGKHKGGTGSGACTGTHNDDGSSDWTCTGSFTMGM